MVAAVANPHVDILGHCTGRLVDRRARDPAGVVVRRRARVRGLPAVRIAVEINCRPERLDPPRRLLRLAVETGCLFSIDTDAHAPGQLDWQPYGCARAQECEVPADRVINTASGGRTARPQPRTPRAPFHQVKCRLTVDSAGLTAPG